jgi:iron complex outermembrane recepter protein
MPYELQVHNCAAHCLQEGEFSIGVERCRCQRGQDCSQWSIVQAFVQAKHPRGERVVRRTGFGIFSMWMLTFIGPAFAQSYVIPVSIGAGPLTAGLQTLERQTGIELLFDGGLITGFQSPAVQGDLTPEAALRQLLSETALTVRRAESGAWVVEPPAAPALAQPDAVVPEILIVGQRTENADIRRTENDVQPYTVATKAEIVGAHRDNIDQYFTSRITANTQNVPAGLAQAAVPYSEIDLRGLGPDDTLVLIDGRRMPSFPSSGSGFHQTDLNAIPLHAIQRIEVLTGAAGGIYGFGALGGVVNVVLDHNTRGLELYATGGISSRGDAGRKAVEASFGHTSEDGQTDISLYASYSESDPLLVGERGYVGRDRQQLNALFPGQTFLNAPTHGNSIAVYSSDGSNLALKPQFGGAPLPSDHTFLPAGFSASPAALAASLTQHAGQVDFSLANGDANSDLGSNPRSEALLVNVRHRFGEVLEAYVDAVLLSNRGQSTDRRSDGQGILGASSAANPFTKSIDVYFPISQMVQQSSKHDESNRYTAGLLTELPFGWRATAEANIGTFRYASWASAEFSRNAFLLLFGSPSDLEVNPLGDWNVFQQAITADPNRYLTGLRYHNRFRSESLRLAGPMFSTAQGPATLTLLAEHRREDVPTATDLRTSTTLGTTITTPSSVPSRSSATTSLYTELRSRLLGAHAPALLRGLELQLAVRRDDQDNDFARDPIATADGDGGRVRVRFVGTAYTVGAKVTPWHWLMLRASYATGEQPPSLDALRENDEQTTTLPYATDPKRGSTLLGAGGPYLFKSGGYQGLKTVRANTAFLGTVLTPFGADGLRLAIEFSRIRKIGDVLPLPPQLVMAHEDYWPQRITRAPLTNADRALGYTAGPVTVLDTRAMNGTDLEVDALDAHAEWPLAFLKGRLRLYADATHHLNNREKELFQPDIQNAGYLNGPLKWRANGGFDWTKDPLTIGANVQYFGSSLVLQSGALASFNALEVQAQGSRNIPSQAYLDLHAGWRFSIGGRSQPDDLAVDFGIINVLDKAPPRETAVLFTGPGYSRYGDPRQRRFELVLSGRF